MAARHECGLFAAISLNGRENVLPIVVNAMRGLQHRGQDSAGVVLRHPGGRLARLANLGLVPDLAARLPQAGGVGAAIGHVRYATFGSRGQDGTQPVLATPMPMPEPIPHWPSLSPGTWPTLRPGTVTGRRTR
jgi:amidophosphoribosyltransferase